MCVAGVRVATITTRTMRSCAPYIGALPASVPSSVFFLFLIARNSVGFPLCAFAPLHICASAPLRLCASAPMRLCASVLLSSQRCSRLTSALVSVLLFSLLWSSLCSGLLSASHSSRATSTLVFRHRPATDLNVFPYLGEYIVQ